MECIILAGGLGTRLRGTIGEYPKCMAEVGGRPFIEYLIRDLEKKGCSRVILSLGYKHEILTDWIQTLDTQVRLDYVVETEALGTGGGILLAMNKATVPDVFVLNGDTYFDVDFDSLWALHSSHQSACTLSLKKLFDFDRYGVVETDSAQCITAFREKASTAEGCINGGVYLVHRESFLKRQLPSKFSFEKDYLEKFVGEKKFFGSLQQGYFIDIGIPEDYEKAQKDFKVIFPF